MQSRCCDRQVAELLVAVGESDARVLGRVSADLR